MKIIILIASIFFLVNLNAQPGCTDPLALNYDSNATENDGSCLYPMTNYTMTEITQLSESLKECSGAELLSSGRWVHNDRGNEHEVYLIDSLNGEILHTANIANVGNIDWEDLAESENYLYIGDFGNNGGNRTDLRIYRINKNDLSNSLISAEIIQFAYSDQVDFSENNNNNNFDCEAFLFHDDQLHLFTKNWVDHKTKHYTLPAVPGFHMAQLKDSFDVAGLITSADISLDDEIVLLGYTTLGLNFMWLLFDFNGNDFFSGNKRRISLGSGVTNSQTEGITFRENGYGYVSSEQFKVNDQITLPQKLLSFSINQWIGGTTSTKENYSFDTIKAFPNPFQNSFEIENPLNKTLCWKLFNNFGQLVKNGELIGLKTKIDVDDLPSGIYYLSIFNDKHQCNFTLIKE